MRDCGYIDFDEPFTGLLTQGMVCHQTYVDGDGNLLFPEQVTRRDDGALVHAETGVPVTAGRSEKMSKSRKNVVDPEAIIGAYGADTARLFMLSDSPPERDLDWTDTGVEGAWRYLNRLWRMISEPAVALPGAGAARPASLGPAAEAAHRAVHKTIAATTGDLERFHFNRAVARVRELCNVLTALSDDDAGAGWVLREGLETVLRLIAPMTPHVAEELWRALGHETMLADVAWPDADPALLTDDIVVVAVQVNGKKRSTLELVRDAAEDVAEAAALADPAVARAIGNKPVRRVIVVPNRIVNVVV